jgi:hypothetical protein
MTATAPRGNPIIPFEGIAGFVPTNGDGFSASERETAPESAATASGQDTIELFAKEFKAAMASFTAAAGSPLLVARPEDALVGFRKLMDRLWAIERSDGRGRIVIWTLDLGQQVFEDFKSRKRFMHVQELVTRFKALARFKDDDTLNWLKSRAVVVLHDGPSGQSEASPRPAFEPRHVLFNTIPRGWAGSPNFDELYGSEPDHGNYSIFLRTAAKSEDRARQPGRGANAAQSYTLRYFGHAVKSGENGEPTTRGLQLDAPGGGYDEALGTVFAAAHQVLGLRGEPTELVVGGTRIVAAHAVENLKHHGFRVLSVDEFMRF